MPEDTPTKQKLSPEERKARVKEAREAPVREFFTGKNYDYIGPVTVDEGYTDVTGNKGKNGHTIKDRADGSEHVVGPTTLKKGVEVYHSVHGYEPPARRRNGDSE